MSENNKLRTFDFDGYKLRPAKDGDLELAREWMQADNKHLRKFPANFWIQADADQREPGVDRYVLEDERGGIFFVRVERVARIHLLFGPDESRRDRIRNMAALSNGLRWLRAALGVSGIRELVFDSGVERLRTFAVSALGFIGSPELLTQRIPVYIPKQKDPANSAPQGSTE